MIYDNKNNKFTDLAYSWFNLLEDISSIEPKRTLKDMEEYERLDKHMDRVECNVFKRMISSINGDYLSCIKDLESTDNKWFLTVRDYIYFVKICEKIFMFNNSEEESDLFAKIDDLKDLFYLELTNSEYKIKISFQDSSINMPGSHTGIPDDDDPLGFMKEPSRDEINYVLFINIDTYRDFGEKMTDSFKFIYNSNMNYNDESDEIQCKVIRNIITKMIINQLNYILETVIPSMSRISSSCWKRDVIDHIKLKKVQV